METVLLEHYFMYFSRLSYCLFGKQTFSKCKKEIELQVTKEIEFNLPKIDLLLHFLDTIYSFESTWSTFKKLNIKIRLKKGISIPIVLSTANRSWISTLGDV